MVQHANELCVATVVPLLVEYLLPEVAPTDLAHTASQCGIVYGHLLVVPWNQVGRNSVRWNQ